MKVNWGRELITWAQYFCFSFVAATAGLLYQAAYDFERTYVPDDGMTSCFSYNAVLKESGVYYGWLLRLFLFFSAVRFLNLLAASRGGLKLP